MIKNQTLEDKIESVIKSKISSKMQIVLLFPNKIKPNEMVSAETLYLKGLKNIK